LTGAAGPPPAQEKPMSVARAPAVTPAAALLAVALAASPALAATEFPTLKSGQWEMTTTSSAAPANTRKTMVCLDASTQKQMLEMSQGMQKEMCTKMEMRRDGAKYITDAECRLGDSVVRSHGVMTMLSDTAYRTEASATFDPPINKDLKESKTTVEGKFLGPCRDGMQPGDMLMPNGQKINLNKLPQPPAARGKQ
jgi:hypothetical protein